MPRSVSSSSTLLLVLLLLLLGVARPAAARHPRLVSLEATRCTTCHTDISHGAVVHPPVTDDCTTCHQVDITEDGTAIGLAEQEPDLCLMCHDGLEAAAAGEMASPHAPVTDSCLSCHVAHAGDQPSLLAAPVHELCATCHDHEELQASHGGQLTATVRCTSCHLPHGGGEPAMLLAANQHAPFADGACNSCHREPFADRIRLRARGQRVCTACHDDMSEQAGDGGSVHAALEGDRTHAGCVSCHDPHMSANDTLLTRPAVALCAECHPGTTARAAAETGHAPAAEDCLTCHLPHSSPQQALLVDSTPALCTMCHDTGDEELAAAHLGADLDGLDCTACHSPHGEGNAGLLARTVHPPVLDGCDVCHEGAADQLMAEGGSDLCLACHDDIGEAASQATVPHAALEMVSCADCHNPHASAHDRLLREPAGGVCTVCHEDQVAGSDGHTHQVITAIGCRACHEPHGSANAVLLRRTGSQLCLDCHDTRRLRIEPDAATVRLLERFEVPATIARAAASLQLSVDGERNHPVLGHRTLGVPTAEELERTESTHTGELTCATCHVPHTAPSAMLLQWEAASTAQACLHCHPK